MPMPLAAVSRLISSTIRIVSADTRSVMIVVSPSENTLPSVAPTGLGAQMSRPALEIGSWPVEFVLAGLRADRISATVTIYSHCTAKEFAYLCSVRPHPTVPTASITVTGITSNPTRPDFDVSPIAPRPSVTPASVTMDDDKRGIARVADGSEPTITIKCVPDRTSDIRCSTA